MTLEQATRDPVLLKVGGAVALFLLGGQSKTARLAAAGLAAWAAWDYYQRRQRPPLAVQPIPTAQPLPAPTGFRPQVIPGGVGPHMGGKGGDPADSLYQWRMMFGPDVAPPAGSRAAFELEQQRRAQGIAGADGMS